jgi:hypothetical protein
MSQLIEDYVRDLGISARNNALAYGYSIAAAASFGVLPQTARPDGPRLILLGGACYLVFNPGASA